MPGWLDEIEAREGKPGAVVEVEPGRDVTTRRRTVVLENVDVYTGSTNAGGDERRVNVGAATAITIYATMQADPARAGAAWVNRTIKVRRVLGTKLVDLGSLTPASPSLELTSADLGGATELSIGPLTGSGAVDTTSGSTVKITVQMTEGIVPAQNMVSVRATQQAAQANVEFGGI